jgi:gluconolactonase
MADAEYPQFASRFLELIYPGESPRASINIGNEFVRGKTMRLRMFGVFLLGVTTVTVAQTSNSVDRGDRFKPLKFGELSTQQQGFITSVGVEGKPGVPHDVDSTNTTSLTYELIRSPELAEHLFKAGAYLRGAVPRKLGEIAILLTARHWNAQYVWWSHHSQYAEKFGVSREIVEGIAVGRRPSSMQADEERVYNFCTELLENGQVSDESFDALKELLGSEQGVVDLIALMGFYGTNAMLLNVDRFPLPEGVKPELEPVVSRTIAQTASLGSIVELDTSLNSIVEKNAKLEVVYHPRVPTDFEGPVWIHNKRSGYLIFNSRPGNVITMLGPDGKVSFYLENVFTGKMPQGQNLWNANGTTLDRQGRVVYCGSSAGAVIRLEKDGKHTVLADRFDGKRLNAPNDLVYRSDGTLYFTDSGKPIKREDGEGLPYVGLYMLRQGKVQLLSNDFERTNGLAFSPDEKHLYAIDTPRRVILRFDVEKDGMISNGTAFVDVGGDSASGILDGMKVDISGNIYTTGPAGIWVISQEGKHLGTIPTPARATNLAFGGSDGKTLFVTGSSFVGRISLKVAGIRPH